MQNVAPRARQDHADHWDLPVVRAQGWHLAIPVSCPTLGRQPGHVPVPAQQEERGDVGRAPGAVLDHLDVEAVVVVGVVGDDHGPPAVLLDHSGLGQERAAPVAHSDHTVTNLWSPQVAPKPARARACLETPKLGIVSLIPHLFQTLLL